MLPLFILGLALLVGILLLGRWYVSADPKTLVKVLKWTSLIGLIIVGMFLLLTGRLAWALFTLPVLFGWFMRFRSIARTAKNFSKMASAGTNAANDDSSEVETRFFRMVLDHGSGDMDGEILDGTFRGKWLNELAETDLLSLLAECREDDEPSVLVLQAYLDRLYPDWRRRNNQQAYEDGGHHHSADDALDRAGAFDVLGLAEGATEGEIKEAHRRLMSGLHPDHGGSTYLASKINQAKDVLLGK